MEGCSVGSRPSLVVQQCWAGSVKIREQTLCPGPSGSLMSVPCDPPRASLAALASNRHTTKWQGQKGCRWVSYPKSDWLSNGKKASNIKKLLVPSPHMQKASAWSSLCPDHSPDISGQELSIFTSTFFQKPPLIHKHQNVIFLPNVFKVFLPNSSELVSVFNFPPLAYNLRPWGRQYPSNF